MQRRRSISSEAEAEAEKAQGGGAGLVGLLQGAGGLWGLLETLPFLSLNW